MNLKSSGVFSSILILICLILICHIANYMFTKNLKQIKNKTYHQISNNFSNLSLSIPETPAPTQYNLITYDNKNTNNKILCSQINEAQVPCNQVQSCKTPTVTEYQLSDSEIAMIYRDAYFNAGRELLLRTLEGEIE